MKTRRGRPVGMMLLIGFFAFGAAMCALTVVLLLFPGTVMDGLWRVNPEAHRAFTGTGGWAVLLMMAVGIACALAAVGLALFREWGRWIAVAVLTVNLLGDVTGAIVREDPRTLIGVPIGGGMIAYIVWGQKGRKLKAEWRWDERHRR